MSDEADRVADLGYAVVDLDREARQGVPEVVYAPGKTTEQIVGIVRTLLAGTTGPVLVTRVEPAVAADVAADLPDATYDEAARLLAWRRRPPGGMQVAVVSAGTSDGPVAREAAAVCAALGHRVDRIDDVGVAGLHRLLRRVDDIRAADVVIVVAGMEAALSSVVGGLVEVPVVAVPTSTGYGASFDGITALLGMLSGCAAGVTVVGIDNGFGAALSVHRLSMSRQRRAR